MNLSARQLRAFVALADEKHFTRAAQRCHLTQPAFSALIRQLEDSAGLRLFDRDTRNVELTAEGRVLEASARRLLADMELAMDDLRDHAARRRGRVTLAALPSLAAGWLPGLLAGFRERHPGISIDLRDALLDPCLDMVRSGQADFAVASERPDMSELAGEFPIRRPLFPGVPWRSSIGSGGAGAIARHRALSADPAGARQQRAQAPGRGIRRGRATAGVRGGASGHGDRPGKGGLGVSVVPAMTLFHFGGEDLRIVPLAGRALTRPLHLARGAQPVGGGAGLV